MEQKRPLSISSAHCTGPLSQRNIMFLCPCRRRHRSSSQQSTWPRLARERGSLSTYEYIVVLRRHICSPAQTVERASGVGASTYVYGYIHSERTTAAAALRRLSIGQLGKRNWGANLSPSFRVRANERIDGLWRLKGVQPAGRRACCSLEEAFLLQFTGKGRKGREREEGRHFYYPLQLRT